MTPTHSTVDTSVLKRLLSLTAVVCTLVLLTLAASGGAVAQEVDVSLEPQEAEVGAGETTTLSVVVEGAESGVGAYDIEIGTTTSAVTITNATLTADPTLPNVQIAEDGSAVILIAAMGTPENAHQAADEITIAELTVEGQTVGESAGLILAPDLEIGPIDTSAGGYDIGGIHNSTVTVVESTSNDSDMDGNGTDEDDDTGTAGDDDDTDTDEDDGSGPGIGIAGAVLALVAAVALSRWL